MTTNLIIILLCILYITQFVSLCWWTKRREQQEFKMIKKVDRLEENVDALEERVDKLTGVEIDIKNQIEENEDDGI